jgi:hypothetical protein
VRTPPRRPHPRTPGRDPYSALCAPDPSLSAPRGALSFAAPPALELLHSGELFDLERDADETAPILALAETPESAAARARLEGHARAYFPGRELP